MQQPKRGCWTKKLHHKSQEAADKHIRILETSPRFIKSEYPLKAYKCRCGKGWCIGHDRHSKAADSLKASA